jgi:hypothetical protein
LNILFFVYFLNDNNYNKNNNAGTKYGMAEVCVRVSLQTPSGIEVNYIENILTIHYYFSDGFYTLDEFNVQKQDAEVTGIDMGSIIRAYDCSLQTTSGIKSQGMVLRVCIEPMVREYLYIIHVVLLEHFIILSFSLSHTHIHTHIHIHLLPHI